MIPINLSEVDKAIITCIQIGKCISETEVLRDFSGWAWQVNRREIESSECNIVYIMLSYLLGYKFMENFTLDAIKKYTSTNFYIELEKFCLEFYKSYNKAAHERILKRLADDKTKLQKMKKQSEYIIEIGDKKRELIKEIERIDQILTTPQILRNQFIALNARLPEEKKIFSVSDYSNLLMKQKNKMMQEINEYNKLQNPATFFKMRDNLEYEIKLFEERTDITKLENEFLKCFMQRILTCNDRKIALDLIYETRYLNFVPSLRLDLRKIEEALIPVAIETGAIEPVSDNDRLDYRILRGIFDCKTMRMEDLLIRLTSGRNTIHVEIFDDDELLQKYDVILPDGSTIEIRKTRKLKIFA